MRAASYAGAADYDRTRRHFGRQRRAATGARTRSYFISHISPLTRASHHHGCSSLAGSACRRQSARCAMPPPLSAAEAYGEATRRYALPVVRKLRS